MHPILGNADKQLACHEYIDALHQCHEQGFMSKYIGACNDQKAALNMCLRNERLARTEKNRELAKERTAKKKAVWEALEKEKAEDSM